MRVRKLITSKKARCNAYYLKYVSTRKNDYSWVMGPVPSHRRYLVLLSVCIFNEASEIYRILTLYNGGSSNDKSMNYGGDRCFRVDVALKALVRGKPCSQENTLTRRNVR